MLKSTQSSRTGLLIFSLLLLVGTAAPLATGNIVLSDFKGTWRIALRGNTSCGFTSALATITFGTAGTGTGTLQQHGECGDSTLAGQTLTVTTLAKTGKGTATLTCGTGCAWDFEIQVAPDRSKFNLSVVSPLNVGVFLEGVAILSSPADNIVIPDMKGDWQVTLFGYQRGDCGNGGPKFPLTVAGTLTLDNAGAGNMSMTVHTQCDDFEDPVTPLTITGLNADGSGTAHLECDDDDTCALDFEIQVSPDRSTFNLVIVSPTDTGNFWAGVAIRRSTGGHIVKANLAGAWQAALGGADSGGGCNISARIRFTLSPKGVATNTVLVYHDECDGDGSLTGTFKVLTLNPDGSGTARFTCGDGCELNFRIQVSPDRSTFSLVDVSTPDQFGIGKAIHQ
jgi:hypothetical protein